MQDLKDGEVQRRQRLGGMLTYYYGATACVVEFWTSGDVSSRHNQQCTIRQVSCMLLPPAKTDLSLFADSA